MTPTPSSPPLILACGRTASSAPCPQSGQGSCLEEQHGGRAPLSAPTQVRLQGWGGQEREPWPAATHEQRGPGLAEGELSTFLKSLHVAAQARGLLLTSSLPRRSQKGCALSPFSGLRGSCGPQGPPGKGAKSEGRTDSPGPSRTQRSALGGVWGCGWVLFICPLSWKVLGKDLAAPVRTNHMRRSVWGTGQSWPFGHQVWP